MSFPASATSSLIQHTFGLNGVSNMNQAVFLVQENNEFFDIYNSSKYSSFNSSINFNGLNNQSISNDLTYIETNVLTIGGRKSNSNSPFFFQHIVIKKIDISPVIVNKSVIGATYPLSYGTTPYIEPLIFKDYNGEIISSENVFNIYEYNGEVVEKIDTTKLGVYTIKTYAVDSNGAVSKYIIRTANVLDSLAPSIKLVGKDTIILKKGQTYEDEGSIVIDNIDGEFIVFSDDQIDYNKPGTYTISYYYVDSASNKSEVITRTIIIKPNDSKYLIIVLLGASILGISIFIILKSKFKKRF